MKMLLTQSRKALANILLVTAVLSSLLAPAGTAQASSPVQVTIPPVELLAPADASMTYATADHPRALPLFQWKAVPGAKSYKLEIDTAENFQSVDLVTVTTSFTNWAPTVANLPDDVTLYWHVKVKSMTGASGEGPYSDTWTFKKDWTRLNAGTYNMPTLLQPENEATIAFTDQTPGDFTNRPAFSWTPVIGATFYRLEFSRDETFAPASIVRSYETLSTTYQPEYKLTDGLYFWRVVPWQDGVPDWDGRPSAHRSITLDYNTVFRPTLISPADHSQPEFTPTFRWSSVRGAEKYYIEISTDPTFAGVVPIPTYATSYTPTKPLENNTDYFWRVRVMSGNSQSKIYSDTWQFRKMWYRKPVLLTPTQGYQYANDTFFSWTPVPGAASYRIEVDYFNPLRATPANKDTTSNTFYAFSSKTYNCPPFNPTNGNRVFWQVTALDANGNDGGKSLVGSFDCSPAAYAPVQVYPPMYYNPLTNPEMDPREDNTVPLPMFAWKRILVGSEETQAAAYRIQVADRENIELYPGAVKYTFDTENMNAIPNLSSLLPDGGGQTTYYWRVRSLTSIGGSTIGQWSQEWRMRYNPNLLPPTTAEIQPLRPIQGSEWVETLPLFEWVRLQNATSYRVQISDDAAFSSPIGTYSAEYPAYSHPERLDPGTYYWRVCGITSGNPQCDPDIPSEWSSPIRFQVAAQSRWRCCRVLGSNNSPVIATDPPDDEGLTANYDLTNLSITQGAANWFIGFNANTGPDMKYAIYIDTDHIDNSGATYDPEGYSLSTIPAHQPEYVIYVSQEGGVFGRATSRLYAWDSYYGAWNTAQMFSQLAGADLLYNPTASYLELVLPGSLIGQSDTVSSLAVSVLSVGNSGEPYDSVPSDPNVTSAAGSAQVSRFVSVTDRINLISPSYKSGNDPTVFTTVPAFFWQPLVEVPSALYFELRIGLDMDTSDPNYMTTIIEDRLYNNPAIYTFPNDVEGDEPSYYWQIRPWYGTNGPQGGWSQVSLLQREGKPVQGLTVTNEQWTPVFNWNLAEGGYDYYLQIDDDPAFTSPYIDSVSLRMNSYTAPVKTFENGKTYYARVQLGRTSSITNDFSNPVQFSVQRPAVTGLRTIPAASQQTPAPYNPTFCWDPIPSAFEYLFEVFWDPAFQTIYYHDETEQSCYTHMLGKLDGEFFWRVSMLDGSGKSGPPSEAREFWKIYPAPTPIYPKSVVVGTPVFRWSGVNGAEKYYIEIADKPDFSTIRYKKTTVNTEHQPEDALGFGDYYWRVKIIDRDGIEGPFSDYVYIEYYKTYLPIAIR